MKDRIDAILQAFMDHQAMEETKSYLERGRRFAGLTVDDLSKGWAAAFTAVCAYGDESRSTIWELSLVCETSRGPSTSSVLERCRPLRRA